MALMFVCDSCGAEITPEQRVQMIYPTGVDAGVNIEICLTCAAGVLKDTKVKKAAETFAKRRDAAAATTAPLRDRAN